MHDGLFVDGAIQLGSGRAAFRPDALYEEVWILGKVVPFQIGLFAERVLIVQTAGCSGRLASAVPYRPYWPYSLVFSSGDKKWISACRMQT